MKKSFTLAFMFCIVLIFGVCGFFLFTQNNPSVEITIAENLDDGFSAEQTFRSVALDSGSNEPVAYFSNLGANNGYKNYIPTPFMWSYDHIIYDVVLMNLSDYSVFTEDNYTDYAAGFDEAAEYISTMSRGITKMEFNYYLYNNNSLSAEKANNTPYNFSVEKQIVDEALSKGYCLSSCGTAMGRIIMVAYDNSYNYQSFLHNHVWYSNSFKERFMIVRSSTYVGTLAHELLHTVGLTDLYVNDYSRFEDYPMVQDIMSQEELSVSVNPYSRYKLGWLDESFANDGVETAIETITETGRYTLNNAFSQEGTISFKFGSKNNEVFYIESGSKNSSNTLYIQRINTSYEENRYAKNESQMFVNTMAWINGDHTSPESTKITPTHNPLKYANGSILNVSIGNITREDNGQISFDFFYGDSTNVDVNIIVNDKKTKKAIPNVNVYINDDYQSTTGNDGRGTVSATSGDIIKLVANDFYESSFYITGKAFNLKATGEIELDLVSFESDSLKYKFEFTVQDQDSSYDISPYDVAFYINDEIVKYSIWGINLAQGDKLEISSSHFMTQKYNFKSLTLKGTKTIYLENDTFHITTKAKTNNYYIQLFNEHEPLAKVGKISAFSSATNTWEEISSVSVVYKLEVPYYQITNIPGKYTRLAFEYTACGMTSSTTVFLENDKYEYRQKLEKTLLQVAGDFVTSIGTNIKDFFGGIFKSIF